MTDFEDKVLPYRRQGDAAEPQADWWVVTSWAAFLAVFCVVVGGALWVLRDPRTAEGTGIIWAFGTVVAGVVSVCGLVSAVIMSLPKRGRHRWKAIPPWVLAVAVCATMVLLAAFGAFHG
jgi:hypothetical protein